MKYDFPNDFLQSLYCICFQSCVRHVELKLSLDSRVPFCHPRQQRLSRYSVDDEPQDSRSTRVRKNNTEARLVLVVTLLLLTFVTRERLLQSLARGPVHKMNATSHRMNLTAARNVSQQYTQRGTSVHNRARSNEGGVSRGVTAEYWGSLLRQEVSW